MNIFEVVNAIRREKLVDFVSIHPQLCADDGDMYLQTIAADKSIERLFIAGCDPVMQHKMFRDALREAGFDTSHHFAVDIRNMQTDQAIEAIKNLITVNS